MTYHRVYCSGESVPTAVCAASQSRFFLQFITLTDISEFYNWAAVHSSLMVPMGVSIPLCRAALVSDTAFYTDTAHSCLPASVGLKFLQKE